ncbi:MAG: HAD-IC family P-type ATPase [Chloroflexi bacterium]|nr:HAD-IC family P-type ATPase [Chloroflexota bacterium]
MALPTPDRPVQGTLWHTLDRAAVEALLSTGDRGLTRPEAASRLARHGPNALEEAPPPSELALLLHQFKSPLISILLIAAVVTTLLHEYIDTGVILAVVLLNAAIGFTQERQAERAVRALMRLMSPRARVVREGHAWDVESRELVAGDLVLLESGVRIPADLRLVSTTVLLVDESLLTGESLPVGKVTEALATDAVLADRLNMAYAGTVVTSGRGRGYVVATGTRTELGGIAESVRAQEEAETPLQARLGRFARLIGVGVVASAVLAILIGLAIGQSLSQMFLVAVALAVSAVPEGLPVVFTITLAIGVRRMAQRNAIIRRLPAVETLGSTTTICSDKTGTMTENRMTVRQVWAAGRTYAIGGQDGWRGAEPLDGGAAVALAEHRPLYLTLLAGVLTNEADISRADDGFEIHGDPTEGALLVAAARLGVEPEAVREAYALHSEVPFESERQYSASVRLHGEQSLLFVKGAPERILAMSTQMLGDDGPTTLDRADVHQAVEAMATLGLRVLAMAYRVLPDAPRGAHDLLEPRELLFLGIQGMMDPPRAGVREAVADCRDAGIRVVMITGDHAATARTIGRELGLVDHKTPVLTGRDLEALDDDDLRVRVQAVAVYARVAPEHKLRVVRALQSHGEVVAMTGDGVNDAPALKVADIGIAMGRSGTDVAREAADMVLADDDFVSIYAAVEEGRITFDNVRKVTFLLVSTAAAEIITILVALGLGWPLPFVPAQLLWLNLVTNGLQDVALAFEPGEPDILKRPPRRKDEGILSHLLWERTVVTGIVMAAGVLLLFRSTLDHSGSLAQAQTAALTTMVLFQNVHVWNSRSEFTSALRMSPFSNRFLAASVAAALLVHVAALHLPASQFVLRVEPLDPATWGVMALVAATILPAIEAHKLLRRRPKRRAS